MTTPRSELKNVPASVHARLLAFAKKENRVACALVWLDYGCS